MATKSFYEMMKIETDEQIRLLEKAFDDAEKRTSSLCTMTPEETQRSLEEDERNIIERLDYAPRKDED